jgi:4-alpha-glucanotransferase
MYESPDAAQWARNERAHAQWRMLEALRESGAFDGGQSRDNSEGPLGDDVFVAAHRYMARTPCRLFGLQLEDLAGASDMVNLPGTDTQYANWRRKQPVLLEELPSLETLRRTVDAVARERPRSS